MTRDPQILREFLARHPEAWPVRMALIEELVRDGDVEEARRVIRDSPAASAMPEDYRQRIHVSLTQGAEGVKTLAPLLGFEERKAASKAEVAPGKEVVPKTSPGETASGLPPRENGPPAKSLDELAGKGMPSAGPKLPEKEEPPLARSSAGSAALVERPPATFGDETGSALGAMLKPASQEKPPSIASRDPLPKSPPRSATAAKRPAAGVADLSGFAWAFLLATAVCGAVLLARLQARVSDIWTTTAGQRIQASVVDFDFDKKRVTLEDKSGLETALGFRQLDFPSKRQLFMSGTFQKQLWLTRDWALPQKLRGGALFASLSLLLFAGWLWLSGVVIARRASPVLAVTAVVGAWSISALLMATYYVVSQRSATGGSGFLWFGAAVSMGIAGMFVSAIYGTSFIRGTLMVICHLVLAGLTMDLLLFDSESIDPEVTRRFWHQSVFIPAGLADPGEALSSP